MAENASVFYHYCTLAKFVSIIRNKTLRLSNIFFMNDYQEVSWFFEIARRRVQKHLSQAEEWSESDSADDDMEDIDDVVKLHSLLENRRFDHIYAACFSRHKDDLSQWRGYANDGRGITLGLDLDQLVSTTPCPTLKLISVNYDPAEQQHVVDELLDPLLAPESSESSSSSGVPRLVRVFREVAKLAPAYKNPAFRSEDEVRLVLRTPVPPDSETPRDQWDHAWFAGFPSEVEFHESNGRLIPYTKIKLPDTVIRSVGFGPKFGGYENEMALKIFVGKRLGPAEVEFYNSSASYR